MEAGDLPTNPVDIDSIPGPGRFRMPQSSGAQVPQLLSLHTLESARHNQRMPVHTDEDPVQPKIIFFLKSIMILVTKKGECKGSRKYNLFYISQNCHLNSLEMIPINAAFMVKF